MQRPTRQEIPPRKIPSREVPLLERSLYKDPPCPPRPHHQIILEEPVPGTGEYRLVERAPEDERWAEVARLLRWAGRVPGAWAGGQG